jgi:enoyl-CoA hydratase/carnithine racemase
VSDLVCYEASDGVALLTFNRPERGNAWSGRMEGQYRRALAAAEADDAVRVIVLTGAGRHFCVGADRNALDGFRASGRYDSGVREPQAEPGRRDDPDLVGRHSFLWSIDKPVIAALNGGAAGIGFVIACYCDLRFAAAGAKLTTSTARLGLPAEYGLSWVLPRLVGLTHAASLLLTGTPVLADEAHRIGLVNDVFPADRLLDETLHFARRMARECAPSSLRATKQQLYADLRRPLGEADADAVRRMEDMIGSADFNEGVAALVERRAPNFLGRETHKAPGPEIVAG